MTTDQGLPSAPPELFFDHLAAGLNFDLPARTPAVVALRLGDQEITGLITSGTGLIPKRLDSSFQVSGTAAI